jgi:Na+/H+-dicarboxylate symporter
MIKTPIEQIYVQSLKSLSLSLQRLRRAKLWLQILVAMGLGILTGVLLSPDFGWLSEETAELTGEWLGLPGQIFLALIQMVMVPLILASIIRGIAAASDIQQLKSVGAWLGSYFLFTTALSVMVGLSVGLLIRPGSYIDNEVLLDKAKISSKKMDTIEDSLGQSEAKNSFSLKEIPDQFAEILPKNPMNSIVEGEMLEIVIFSLIFGVGLLMLKPSSSKPLLDLFGSIQEVSMAVVGVAMSFAPIAVFGLLAQSLIKTGPQVLLGMGVYVLAVIAAMGLLLLVYTLLVVVFGKISFLRFLRAARAPMVFGFSTNSSAATMPITVKSAEEDLELRPSLSQLIVPIGATVNMGGTACYQGLATLFMAQMLGIDLALGSLLALVITAVGASIGTPAVPGVGIIVLSGVLSSAGIPLVGLPLIIGIDRILERFRTALNVTGDLAACAVINRIVPFEDRFETELDQQKQYDQDPGLPYHETVIQDSNKDDY